jgi:hypothetical protein
LNPFSAHIALIFPEVVEKSPPPPNYIYTVYIYILLVSSAALCPLYSPLSSLYPAVSLKALCPFY